MQVSLGNTADEMSFSLQDEPRIRHITGVQIHQLTVNALRDRPRPARARSASRGSFDSSTLANGAIKARGTSLTAAAIIDEDKPLSSSPDRGFTRPDVRRLGGPSTSHARSISGSAIDPSSPTTPISSSFPSFRQRTASDASSSTFQIVTRARASTLTAAEIHTTAEEQQELGDIVRHRLARCFVAFYDVKTVKSATDIGKVMTRSASLTGPASPVARTRTTRPSLSQSSSSTTLSSRSRTSSTPTTSLSPSSPKSTASKSRTSSLKTTGPAPSINSPPRTKIPFFLSPVHRPSTHPRFLGLDAEADFAPWLDVTEAAAGEVEVEIWVEVLDEGKDSATWRRLKDVGGKVILKDLKRIDSQTPPLPDNTLIFTFASDPDSRFYQQQASVTKGTDTASAASETELAEDRKRRVALGRDIVRTAVERSLRETRMKKGPGIGALHQFVNMQAVLADTKRGVEELRTKIDGLLLSPSNIKAPKRNVAERRARIKWIKSKVVEVEHAREEAHARIVLQQHILEERRKNLAKAVENEGLLRGYCDGLQTEIEEKIDKRADLQPAIHGRRAHLTQILDGLFPIAPVDPASLLYTILGVPLPIPVGLKDPAPPVSIPAHLLPSGVSKVDEETTATALGYAAMVVQLLGNVTDRQVPYPVTCAGSRSIVKDLVSVMQGPRSFPLYAKGVERYRYEYAVFLLNKDIEMLMFDCNIRILDLRHTLPNLKNLLLTLSSPQPLPAPNHSLNNTRPSSRADTHSLHQPRGIQSQIALGLTSSPLVPNRVVADQSEIDLASESDANLEKEAAAAEDVSDFSS